jgi:predicted extracellular nuclease
MGTSLPGKTSWICRGTGKWLKKLRTGFLFLFLLSITKNALAQPSELFISEYVEGSANNKAIEIYNGTGSAINLATGNYSIQMFFNGSATPGLTINLLGVVASGDVFVLAQASASADILALANQTNSYGWYNGDDAVVLRKGTTVIDAFGQVGFDPGAEWGTGLISTADNTLRRKSAICSGDVNQADVFNPSVEWDGYTLDEFRGLGNDTVTCGSVISFLYINDVSAPEGNSGTTTFSFKVHLSAPAGAGGVSFDIATAGNTATSPDDFEANSLTAQTIPEGSSNYWFSVSVNGDLTPESNETFFVNVSNVSGTTLTDSVGVGTITNDDIAEVKIHDIQGNGNTSPLTGTLVSVEGIVTRTFTGSTKLNGFFVQEEDVDADADPATSEGIFVYDNTGKFSGNIGDRAKITGRVVEFSRGSFSLTEIGDLSAVTVNSTNEPLPTIANVQLPVNNVDYLEKYEGMLVEISAATGNLTVTENFQLGRYGQVILSAIGPSNQPGTDARLDEYTQFNTPSVSGYTAYLEEIAKRRIYLDDGSATQNNDPILFGIGGLPLSATNTLRGGDQVESVVGIMDQRFEGYRIQTLTSPNFIAANERPATPPPVNGSLKVASMNALNYFNGDGLGGGFPTSRGANTLTEFNRQRDKIIHAIVGSGADIIGLMEMENDGYASTSAIQDLVNGLNSATTPGTYVFINPGNISSDEITVSFLYKPGVVTPAGSPAALTSGTFALVGRGSLAQTFEEIATGEKFTAVVNHFRSKGTNQGGPGDMDAGDGQDFSNGTRTRQAQELATWLLTKPTGTDDPDYILMGDLNCYAKEDPITTLNTAGYANLLPITSYSYVFEGQVGSLDHALGSSSFASQVSGAEIWHINADEPTVLDYNEEYKTAEQVTNLYSSEPYRASDHDPLIIGLNLCTTPSITNVAVTQPNCITSTGIIEISATGVGTLEYSINGTLYQESKTFSGLAAGNYTISARSKTNTGCLVAYAGNPVAINSAPFVPIVYNVSGGGGKCGNIRGGVLPTSNIYLSGSQTGVTYQLVKDGVNTGSPVAGTGNSLTFVESNWGVYTITALSSGGCYVPMSGTAVIYTNSRPEKYNVTGGGQLCKGSNVVVGLSSSAKGVNYLLKNNNIYTGLIVAGTGSAISFGKQPVGTYTVDAVNAATGCETSMNGSAVVLAGKNCSITQASKISITGDTAEHSTWAQIAPNPVSGNHLNLLVKGFAGKQVSWNLINAQGSVIAKNRFTAASNSHNEKLIIGDITPGTYLLQLYSRDKKTNLKVMKIN